MSANPKIEWVSQTFSPWTGSQKIGTGSDDAEHCYGGSDADALVQKEGGTQEPTNAAFSLSKTVAALAVYDADAPRRNALWENIDSNQDALDAEKADDEAANLVRNAFALDTADINKREECMCVRVESIRRMVDRSLADSQRAIGL